MATAKDPTAQVVKAIVKYQLRLIDLWKRVFKKVRAMLTVTTKFLAKVAQQAAQIAAKIGKAAVEKVQEAGKMVVNLLKSLPNLVQQTLRLGKKILDLVRKAADPAKIIGVLKRLFTRYVKLFQEIFSGIVNFVKQLDIIGKALSVVSTFKTVLQFLISWIADVTKAADAVVKVKILLKKVVKLMKAEIRDAIQMRKEVMKLEAA